MILILLILILLLLLLIFKFKKSLFFSKNIFFINFFKKIFFFSFISSFLFILLKNFNFLKLFINKNILNLLKNNKKNIFNILKFNTIFNNLNLNQNLNKNLNEEELISKIIKSQKTSDETLDFVEENLNILNKPKYDLFIIELKKLYPYYKKFSQNELQSYSKKALLKILLYKEIIEKLILEFFFNKEVLILSILNLDKVILQIKQENLANYDFINFEFEHLNDFENYNKIYLKEEELQQFDISQLYIICFNKERILIAMSDFS